MSRIAVLTLASPDRMERVRLQRRALREAADGVLETSGVEDHQDDTGVADLHNDLTASEQDGFPARADQQDFPVIAEVGRIGGHSVVHLLEPLPGRETGAPVPLAAARNAAARRGIDLGADLLVFLDADCVPTPGLVPRYAAAAALRPDALLAGPVTYLSPEETARGLPGMLENLHPHAARPDPQPGELLTIPAREEHREDYHLFWSLSFAVAPRTFQRIGGFCEEYTGYGGEDTDFAYRALAAGTDLVWVGGAHAAHQHHPVSSPPVEHLEDILRNARIFHRRWGSWPMLGWLEAFQDLGLVHRDPDGGWRPEA